jgi:HSP20 family protein
MSMLLRFDPFRDMDRVFDQAFGNGQSRRPSFPMDAYRRGEQFVVHFDLPGVDPDSIDLEVERNVLTVTAERRWQPHEGDDIIANERVQGAFRRQLLLGDTLNTEDITANYENGVLTLTIPVAEKAKPRKVEIQREGGKQAIEATSSN